MTIRFSPVLLIIGSLILNSCGGPNDPILKGLQDFNTKMDRINGTGQFWFKNLSGYKDIATYISNEDQFSAFMNKYNEPRALSEEECLEIIVQLGIAQYAPEWLKPATKAKIDKLIKEGELKKPAASRQNPFAWP